MSEATFTPLQQDKHRKAFIEECRQKAWGARCHAEWVSKGLDQIIAEYEKLQAEDRGLEAEIKALEIAPDYHTVENRNKRKTLQERRTALAKAVQAMGQNAGQAQQAMQQLYASVESSLALAKHAEEWGWKEVAGSAQ
jgi:cell division septum initiation protein DivIVA